jgi:hypothetical protein
VESGGLVYGARSAIGPTAEIEIGWILARRHWRQGYATEAALALRDWAFRELGIPRLISLIHPLNHASVRVAEKIGERYEQQVTTGAGNPALLYAAEAEPFATPDVRVPAKTLRPASTTARLVRGSRGAARTRAFTDDA